MKNTLQHPLEAPAQTSRLTVFAHYFLLAIIAFVLLAQPAYANERYAAIVIDADTNQVLHQANPDDLRYPASLTKMMTLYMTFDALKKGRLRLNQQITVSERAAAMSATNLNLRGGEKITVETAIKALIVRSANDIAAALGEELGQTEWQFAVMMTNKARQLGMSRTVYRNANGLPNDAQVTTARDQAKLSLALRRDFPQYYHYFSVQEFDYRGVTYYTHNRVMRDYPGADGLKTGFINKSGFNLATSVKRDGFSLVGVVLGGKTSRSRDDHMKDLMTRSLRQLAEARRHGTKVATTYASSEDDDKESTQAASRFSPVPTFKPGTEPREQAIALANRAAMAAAQQEGMGDTGDAAVNPATTAAPATYTPVAPFTAPETPANRTQQPATPTPAEAVTNSWGIQVGAFSESRDAFMAAVNAQRLASRELEGSKISVLNPQDGEGKIYRARLANMSEGQARRACRVLLARKEACFVYQGNNS